jgi:hypothetical protein
MCKPPHLKIFTNVILAIVLPIGALLMLIWVSTLVCMIPLLIWYYITTTTIPKLIPVIHNYTTTTIPKLIPVIHNYMTNGTL